MTNKILISLAACGTFVVICVGVKGVFSQTASSSVDSPAINRKRAQPSLLTSEPFIYPFTPELAKTMDKLDALANRAGPTPKYELQMGLIIGSRMSQEDKRCRLLGMSLEEKKKVLQAIIDGGEAEKERVRSSHFKKPFNIQFPPITVNTNTPSTK